MWILRKQEWIMSDILKKKTNHILSWGSQRGEGFCGKRFKFGKFISRINIFPLWYPEKILRLTFLLRQTLKFLVNPFKTLFQGEHIRIKYPKSPSLNYSPHPLPVNIHTKHCCGPTWLHITCTNKSWGTYVAKLESC